MNGTVTNFFWEGDNLAYEMDSSYHPIRRYFYGAGKDNTQSYLEYSEAASDPFLDSNNQGWYSYIKDQVGSIIKTVKHYNDFSTTIKQSKTYDVFGNTITSSGSSTGNLGFQSKYFDTESGMYYYYNRYYKPDLGRFLNEDPIGLSGGYNYYKYVNNNPINNTDSFGLIVTGINKFKCALKVLRYYLNKMKATNWIGADKYFHCLGSCKAAKSCGKLATGLLGLLREFLQFYDPLSDHLEDLNANNTGIYCPKNMTCEDRCKHLAPKGMPK